VILGLGFWSCGSGIGDLELRFWNWALGLGFRVMVKTHRGRRQEPKPIPQQASLRILFMAANGDQMPCFACKWDRAYPISLSDESAILALPGQRCYGVLAFLISYVCLSY
jgi:hypothetical protein